nr:unnamed protein product [Callosobruchus analis]CAI5826838.1 unnamed protein product [Callosobruchus analis]CAI5830650.1 unnamed protein product [Callosobruchus analis]CAI5856166.1 unnamed protein product [Callosobruchus analis]
MKIDVYKTNMN